MVALTIEEQARVWSPKNTSKLLEHLRHEKSSLNRAMPSRKHKTTLNSAVDKERPRAFKGTAESQSPLLAREQDNNLAFTCSVVAEARHSRQLAPLTMSVSLV